MEFVLLSALTLINLLLWLVFLARFKKLFSVDDIMVKFRDGMNNLLKDAERDTALNMNVIDEKIRESKAIVAEAERKLAVLRHELESAEKSSLLQAQINIQNSAAKKSKAKASAKAPSRSTAKSVSKLGGARAAAAYKQNELPGADEAYALTGLFRENAQNSLFDAPQITVTKDGDAYGKVPIVNVPEVTISEEPIRVKKPFARRVRELAELGKTVEEIASETDHSTTEVQLVLDTSI